jgi:hypothetical protein
MKKIFLLFLLAIISFQVSAQNALVTVVTPNGGENWIIGCPTTIQWITSTPSSVKIDLYKNSVFLMTIASQVPPTQSSFTWTPPYTIAPGTTFKVKVTILNGSTTGYDFSNADFSINSGNVTVTSPNGGEVWLYGTTHPITWNDNICENVRIELWKGGTIFSILAQSTPSDGSFSWAITSSYPLGNDYKIKILSVASNSGTTSTVFDFSDNNFTIGTNNTGSVTVITPNGSENWIIGCPYTIQWITSVPSPVKIELYRNGSFYMVVCSQLPAGQNIYSWTPPYTVTPGNNFKIKVSLLTSAAGFDFSNADFAINTGNITVTSPNGGEVWLYGTTHLITWNDNLCDNVRIELWKGGAFFSLLTSSTPSTGSFPWAITPNYPYGIDYKIKVMSAFANSAATTMIYDFSDNFFSIGSNNTNCLITITSPNGGEAWVRGSTHLITWQENVSYPVRIELWKGGVYHSLIATSAPGNGTFSWTLPSTLPIGNNYKVKIIALSSNTSYTCYDFSNNDFNILGTNSGSLRSAEIKATIYPNPCHDLLFINLENDLRSPLFIEIINITGEIVWNDKFDAKPAGGDMKVDISSLSAGYYILVLKQDNEILSRNPLIVSRSH